ncbi:hypothetical protein BT93_L4886 [Corymbia citriodora subsp. variegata]|uniref:AWS domain-containing protein n=1 Tax=Corymbia citriodora subsp. variegata TaxID=360336 RepID=A0A8T0CX24_CORYI|nr:hypothetical protein BT93_L4886 [Corymbia citriodora subsp. variegata]
MPDLGSNPSLSFPLAVACGGGGGCGSDLKLAPPRGSAEAPETLGGVPGREPPREKNRHSQNGGAAPRRNAARTLEDYVGDWAERKAGSGEARSRCFLPFLIGAKRMAKCVLCHQFIFPDEELHCVVRGCNGTYHLSCAKERLGVSNLKNFKCPQHACFICKQRQPHWRCVLCTIASHYKCAAWPEKVMHLKNLPGRAVCWRHPTNSWLVKKHAVSTSDIEEIFSRLPTPYDEEEFKFDITMKDMIENKMEPPPYGHIRRNIYLIRKKRDDVGDGIGCSSCSSMCSDDCVCRVQCISCSKACRCPENCNNRPFRKDKKIKIVKLSTMLYVKKGFGI